MESLSTNRLINIKDRQTWVKIKLLSALFNPKQADIMKAMEKFKTFDK